MPWEKKLLHRSRNNILMCVVLFPRVQGSGYSIISGPVGPIYILVGVPGGGQEVSDVLHVQPLNALHSDGCQCNGTMMQRTCFGCYGGRFEAFWDLVQRCVKDVCEDTARNVVQSCCYLAGVDLVEDSPHAALSPALKAASQVFSREWTSPVIHGFWLGRTVIALVVALADAIHYSLSVLL